MPPVHAVPKRLDVGHTRVSAQPLLATRQLGLDIGGATIVADVSLEVAEGEFLGIIGPNGAGKTSLFNLLSGLYRPTLRVDRRSTAATSRDDAPYRRAAAGPRPDVPGLERLPASTVLRERAAGRGGRRSAGRCGSGAGRAASARRSSGRAGRSAASASARASSGRRARSRTATSASSSSPWCSAATRA